MNSIDYNEEFDQILISARNFNEIWVIDHTTTTEEAAGHTGGMYGKGGDLLYRWGNPQAYRKGNESDQLLFMQHDARFIESGCPGAGNITIFNNGFRRPGKDYSNVMEIVPPIDSNGFYHLEPDSAYGPDEPIWIYQAENPYDFYSLYVSGVQRLTNGNTLIFSGKTGFFFEVTPDKEIVWSYKNWYPIPFPFRFFDLNGVFKINWYPKDYPGLSEVKKL